MRIMQFSDFASWTVSRVPLGLLKGKAMESGTNASHARERNHEVMEEFLSSTIPILHTALLLSLEKIKPEDLLPQAKPPSAAAPS